MVGAHGTPHTGIWPAVEHSRIRYSTRNARRPKFRRIVCRVSLVAAMTQADVLLERPVGLRPIEPVLAIGLAAKTRRIAVDEPVIDPDQFLAIEVGVPDVSRALRPSKGAATETLYARVQARSCRFCCT